MLFRSGLIPSSKLPNHIIINSMSPSFFPRSYFLPILYVSMSLSDGATTAMWEISDCYRCGQHSLQLKALRMILGEIRRLESFGAGVRTLFILTVPLVHLSQSECSFG